MNRRTFAKSVAAVAGLALLPKAFASTPPEIYEAYVEFMADSPFNMVRFRDCDSGLGYVVATTFKDRLSFETHTRGNGKWDVIWKAFEKAVYEMKCRRDREAEDGVLQKRWRKPTSVRIGSPAPQGLKNAST